MSGRTKRSDSVMVAKADEEVAAASAAAPGDEAPPLSVTDGGVWFVLERASLEAAKVGKNYQLLNCDDHANFLRKHKRDPALYRPDILHQALLAILDSPLNKAGKLKGLYVHTEKNVLIQINPHLRIPRTFKRFCGLMVQLLQKLVIRATNGPDKLMKVVKQPVTRHLPLGARRIGMSYSAPKVVQLREYITASKESSPLVFVVGAMSHGKIEVDYIDDLVAVSEYPLSAMWAIARICNALESQWNIDIVMYVNSPGGSVTAGMAIFDTMRHIRPDVSTVCVGLAASMGAFLLSGGTKGKRYSLPNSRIMIHQPLGGAQGQQTDIEIQANEILHHKANLNGYLAYHTGQPYEKIVQDTDRDFFMSAKEAKEYGLIDAVISNPLKALMPLPAGNGSADPRPTPA